MLWEVVDIYVAVRPHIQVLVTVNCVVARTAVELVSAKATVDLIVAVATEDDIVSGPAKDLVIARAAVNFEDAEELYRKAIEIAKYIGNYEQEANCYARLGSVSWAQSDYDAAKTWYEKAFETHEKRGAMNDAIKICTSLGHLSLAKVAGKQRDFAAAKKWFRKGLEIDDNAKWWDWLILHARLWRCRFLSVFSK